MGRKTLFQKMDLILKELRKELIKEYGENLVSAIIFGSVARNTFTEESDIDLLILCKKVPKSRMERLKKFEKVGD